jgi:hypothetical protein
VQPLDGCGVPVCVYLHLLLSIPFLRPPMSVSVNGLPLPTCFDATCAVSWLRSSSALSLSIPASGFQSVCVSHQGDGSPIDTVVDVLVVDSLPSELVLGRDVLDRWPLLREILPAVPSDTASMLHFSCFLLQLLNSLAGCQYSPPVAGPSRSAFRSGVLPFTAFQLFQ